MGQILQNWRILVSASLATVLIVGSFLLARSVESPNSAQASTESALLKAIATKDSDGVGLTDWEEALYGASPNITDTFKLGMTDGEAVARGLIVPKAIADILLGTPSAVSMPADGSLPPAPEEGTLTDTFAKNFFTLYLSAKQANGGDALSESEMANIADEALKSLSSAVIMAPDFRSVKDLKISGSGADALTEFAVNAEAVFLKNTSSASKSELLYLIDAVENNDTEALTHVSSISKAYRDSAVGLSALPVPTELSKSVLALINAMVRVSEITADFSRVNTDPLTAMLALKQYVPTAQSLGKAFESISNVYASAGVTFPSGTPGSLFVNL